MLTAKNRDQLRNPTLGNRVRAKFTSYEHSPTLTGTLPILLPAVVIVVRNFLRRSSVDQADLVAGHPVDADTRLVANALTLTVVDSRHSLDARTAADARVLLMRRPTNI